MVSQLLPNSACTLHLWQTYVAQWRACVVQSDQEWHLQSCRWARQGGRGQEETPACWRALASARQAYRTRRTPENGLWLPKTDGDASPQLQVGSCGIIAWRACCLHRLNASLGNVRRSHVVFRCWVSLDATPCCSAKLVPTEAAHKERSTTCSTQAHSRAQC